MKIQINAKNRSYQFESEAKDKILFAGLRHAINLPYECSTGTCGTCKAKLIAGKVHDHWPEAPGLNYLNPDRGEILMCQCSARSDITIEIGNFIYCMDRTACIPRSFHGTIGRIRLLAQDVMFMEVELDEPLDFNAGQFVVLSVPAVLGFRGYSMVNFQRQARKLEFVIKKKNKGGFTEWLFESNNVEGTKVDLIGPLGSATFHPGIGKNILCIAGGSGIAGMMSILSRGFQERYFDQYKGSVFFGIRTMEDAFFLDELSQIKNAFPDRLQVTIALSDEEVPSSASHHYPALEFDRGLVHEVAFRHMKGHYQNIRAYLAGPPPSVDASVRMLVLEAKLATENIFYDKFN